MTNKSFNQFNQELINKNLVFSHENYNGNSESQHLEAIYSWGYILVYSGNVLPDIYKLCDYQDQLICTLDYDDDWSIVSGYLKCKSTLFNDTYKFSYNLNQGAPIHTEDVKDILLYSNPEDKYDNDRIIILKDGRIFRRKDGESLQELDDASEFYLDPTYKILTRDCYITYINIFNELIIRKN